MSGQVRNMSGDGKSEKVNGNPVLGAADTPAYRSACHIGPHVYCVQSCQFCTELPVSTVHAHLVKNYRPNKRSIESELSNILVVNVNI